MKKALAIMLTSVMVLGLTACGSSVASTAAPTESKPAEESAAAVSESTPVVEGLSEGNWTIDVSTPHPDTTPLGKAIAAFADEVSAKTNGQVEVNVFWNSQLGAEKDEIIAMAADEIQMNICGTQTIDAYAPEYGFLTAPYLYKDMEHFRAVLDSDLFKGFGDKLVESNIRILASGVRGTRQTASNKKLETAADINGLTIRMPDVATYMKAWTTLGASCQLVAPGEIYSSLQQNAIQATEGPYEQELSFSLNEVAKYMIETNHTYEFCAIYVSDAWFQSLPEDIQAIISECAETCMLKATEDGIASAEKDLQALIDGGMEYVKFDNTEALATLKPVWEESFAKEWTVTTYDEVMSYAK